MLTRAPLLLALLLVLVPSSAQAADYKWKMATSWSGGPIYDHGPKAFADHLKFLSNGKFEIQLFHAGVLGKALNVSDTVASGVAEMGHTWVGYDWGKDKTAVLFGGYAGSFDSERMLHWLYEDSGVDLWRKWRKEKFGLIGMPLYIRTAEAFLHSHKPVRSLADLKGLKIRTAGAWLEISEQLGASPLTSAGGDVYPMLERKVIDATEWGTLYENILPGFHRVAKYIIIPGVHQPTAPFELLINEKAWQSLSEHDQKLIELAAKLATFESWTRVGQEDAKAYKFFEGEGNEIVELGEDVQIRAKQLGIEWAEKQAEKNPRFKEVFESQLRFEELWKNAGKYRNVKGGQTP